ncbi:MAG: type IV secretory system conjugative DNA transfer family protein [Candidatus Berkelbacteria bacterium]|nr:type IV secretory system conjugative DNA transfer family protein [Candidatus Berkelbacteria bacterium]
MNYSQYGDSAASTPDYTLYWVIGIVMAVIVFGVFCYFVYEWIRLKILRKIQLEMTEDWVMYKILLPKERHAEEDDQRKNFQEMLAVIEPFYANLNALYEGGFFNKFWSKQPHISIELVAKDGLISFYVGCAKHDAAIVIKNLQAQYPSSEIKENVDFSIFPDKPLKIDILNLGLIKRFIFPIKSYKTLEEDPLNAITNSLSRLGTDQLAGIQFLIRPTSGMWRVSVERVAYNIQHGKSRVSHSSSFAVRASETIFNAVGTAASTIQSSGKEGKDEYYDPSNPKLTPMQENQVKLLGEKAAKLGFECQLRIVAVAPTQAEAQQLTKNIATSFDQFNSPEANGFKISPPKNKMEEIANYIFRIYGRGPRMVLNTEEVATVIHFPNRYIDTPNIHWLLSKKEPPPANLPTEGTIIGKSIYRGEEKLVRIKMADRLRHVYTIGKTGVGKTVLAQNMIRQDIEEGNGVCYLDPNGDAAEWILNHIPKERADDVIYFNPADKERPFGLNMLEWKTVEQRDFLVQESLQIFQKLFDPNQTGMIGPQFEHWMRNACLTLMSHPDGGTIIDVPRIFTDPEFEKDRLKYVTDPVVRSFWEKQMAKTADFHKSEMLNYFTSKFGRFMTNDMMRNIIGQTKSSFDFRDIMDGKKILICNLSKGMIGEINAFLLGMIIVSKIAMGAFSRQDMLEKDRIPFFLYVDEFQNFITDVFATILSESRKYKLGLYITNQYIEQLDEKIRAAVVGNAGTLATFRIGAADAEFFAKEFDPLKPDDLTQIDKFNMYIKMLIDGAPTKPFNLQTIWPDDNEGNPKLGNAIKELSRLKYGRPREVVEEEILERSQVDIIDLPGLQSPEVPPSR